MASQQVTSSVLAPPPPPKAAASALAPLPPLAPASALAPPAALALPPATELPPAVQLPPLQAWLARLGLSGKLLGIGGLVGAIAVFLPLVTMSMQMPTFGVKGGANIPAVSASQSVMVLRDFRGVLCLLGYIAALALTYVLYQPNGLSQKALGWAGAGVGGFTTLLAFWLLIGAFSGSGGLGGFGASFQISVGIGAILNLVAAAVVAAGGVLKAREEKLF